MTPIHILGGGLAGCEAAWQIARAGYDCVLFEMRPVRPTPAHKTDRLAELVCSNSLKSESENTAPWLLKEELRKLDSLLLRAAQQARVPGGHALTVDREVFAQEVSRAIEENPRIELRREEATSIADDAITIIATGPLTSGALARRNRKAHRRRAAVFLRLDQPDRRSGFDGSFYRVPRVALRQVARWNRRLRELSRSIASSTSDSSTQFSPPRPFRRTFRKMSPEDNARFFEACLPIEELARRGRETLRFGPMKPMGLTDPRTGRRPYAVVQLRQENLRADSYNLVGFQNHMRFPEQARVFRMIPGLERAEFLRYGQIHRNTYINAPALLTSTLQLRTNPEVFFAGQISGVEGYVESIATGLVAGRHAVELAAGDGDSSPSRARRPSDRCARMFRAPMRAIISPRTSPSICCPRWTKPTRLRFRHDKKARHAEVCRRALEKLDEYRSVYA